MKIEIELKEVGALEGVGFSLEDFIVKVNEGKGEIRAQIGGTVLFTMFNDKHYLLGIRAHSLSPTRTIDHAIRMKAKVELAEVVGSDTELHVIHEGIRLIVFTPALLRHQIGEEIDVYLDPHQFFIYGKRSKRLIATTFID